MANKKREKRLFSGMSYREVQRSNSNRRSFLPKADQKWLRENFYKNVGWDNIIRLHQKINDLLSSSEHDEPTLEDLFLKADEIGNKYQTLEEIETFNQVFRTEINAIADEIDKQFPDKELEFIDFSDCSGTSSKTKFKKKR